MDGLALATRGKVARDSGLSGLAIGTHGAHVPLRSDLDDVTPIHISQLAAGMMIALFVKERRLKSAKRMTGDAPVLVERQHPRLMSGRWMVGKVVSNDRAARELVIETTILRTSRRMAQREATYNATLRYSNVQRAARLVSPGSADAADQVVTRLYSDLPYMASPVLL